MTFTHLSVHSKASMLFGSADIEKLVSRAKELGQTSLAITDYSNLFDAINFYKVAKEADIKPILGVDLFFCEDAEQLKIQKVRQVSHIVLLAENETGWKNIARIVSRAHDKDHFFYNPRIDFKVLEEYHEGIVCLSGGSLDGVIASNLFDLQDEDGSIIRPAAIFKAEALVRRFVSIFGKNNFFLEVQDNLLDEQEKINERLRAIATKYDIKTVATNNVHYVEQSDAVSHKTLLEMNANKFSLLTRTNFEQEEYYLKSTDEMSVLNLTTDELNQSQIIADRCNVEIDLKARRLPQYKFIPDGMTSMQYLTKLSYEAFSIMNISEPEYLDRLKRELQDIEDMGFADYFLIVQDVMGWCEKQGMLLGYGRGSAGGSLVSYCLGITKIDPIEYGLIWERFLNKGRGGLPDIDTDVPRSQRQKVLEYVKERFGEGNVAQLVTLGGMQAKAILKEVFRVYGMPFDEANKITGLVPSKNEDHVPITLQEAIDTVPELKEYYEQYTPWFKIALSLEGCYKSTGIHAAAVVISDTPFEDSWYPLVRSKDGNALFGWDMNTVDNLSLLKLDILGLTTLDDIQETRNLVKKRRGVSLSRDRMPLDDPVTWAMISQGFTIGIFQIEKQLGRTWSKNLQPQTIEELSDLISIIRPGPMESGMHTSYRDVKNKGGDPTYIHDKLEPIMGRTFSALLYQEQVIQICQDLAQMSLIDADKVRKAMGKKKPEEMKVWKDQFVQGCSNNGLEIVTAEEIWGYIEKFAGYGFNKSHGVGYALLAYETAYLKANYTVEFLAAKLKHAESHPDKFEQMSALSYDAKLFDIEVIPPRMSFGNKDFDVVDDTHIAFGLTATKGVGVTAINDLVKIGKANKTFDKILWTWKTSKNNISSAVITALIRCGAFDDLEEHRFEAQAKFKLLDSLTAKEVELLDTLSQFQEGDFDWIKILRAVADEQKVELVKTTYEVKVPNARRRPKIREALQEYDGRELFDTKAQRIAWEQFYLGIALSGSEADIYKSQHKCIDLVKSGYEGMDFEIAVCVDAIREHIVSKGKSAGETMAFVTARDKTFVMDNIVVFPRTYANCSRLLEEGNVIKIKGSMDDRGSLIANRIERLR